MRGAESPPRAGPGNTDRLSAEDFAIKTSPLRLTLIGQELEILCDLTEPYAENIRRSSVLFAIKDIRAACDRFCENVLPKTQNDFPAVVGGRLDEMA